MKKLRIYFLILPLFVVALSACQSVPTFHGPDLFLTQPRPDQDPPENILRTPGMPLVAAIPGLNVPFAPKGSFQFGELTELLDEKGIPSFIVGYDDAVHPLTDAADLFSDEYSIAITRILPDLTRAIKKENEIRKEQGAPLLEELDVIAYSQGAVLALDLFRRLMKFRAEYNDLEEAAGEEWEPFLNDPQFKLYDDAARNYLAIKNIRVQRRKYFDKDYDLRRFYERLVEQLAEAFYDARVYLTDPKKLYPKTPIFSGKKKGYPRKYPKIMKWFEENYPADDPMDTIPIEFWLSAVEYEELIPLNIRLFSMAGSYFGSPKANQTYGMLRFLPGDINKFIVGPATQQIKETRLGSRYHLQELKDVLHHAEDAGYEHEIKNTYFIVGANGEKGDGMVDQSSAHFSSHLLTEVHVKDLFSKESKEPLCFPYKKLPVYAVTGLKVHHLPGTRFFFFRTPGVAEMSKKSKVYPFLLAFLEKDHDKLSELHREHNQKLRQFMVELDLPYTDELKDYEFTLGPVSKDIKLTGRYYNHDSHTLVWTGVFKSKKHFFDFETIEPPKAGKVILRAHKPFGESIEIELTVNPGTNHFFQIKSDMEKKPTLLDVTAKNLFKWTSRQTFYSFVTGEK